MKVLRITIIYILISISFVLSTGHVTEGDLFWHIKTGEWIWENKTIPQEDPFTFTYQRSDPARPGYLRQEVILKGYWLGQLLYAFLYEVGGLLGVIAFRASVVCLVLVILYLWMRRLGVSFETSLIFLLLSGCWFINVGDRPHLFSFLLFPLVLSLVDTLKDRWSYKQTIMLFFIMALWPNLHGGYIIGVGVTGIYLFVSIFRYLLSRRNRGGGMRFWLGLLLSILATLLNPNTYKTYIAIIQEMRSGVQAIYIAEMLSPFEAFREGYYYPQFWLSLFITAMVILWRSSRIPLERLLVILLFALASLRYQRLIHFFVLSLPFVAFELEMAISEKKVIGRVFRVGGIFVSSLLLLSLGFSKLKGGDIFNTRLGDIFPEACISFLHKNKPEGQLFNWSDWGGYLMLHAPQYRLFHDGRRLMDDIEIAHNAIVWGDKTLLMGVPAWRAYLDSYGIEIIVVPPVHPLFDQFVGLVKELYLDHDFSLVYADTHCLIYLRKGTKNDRLIRVYEIPRELGIVMAIKRLHTYRTESERLSKARLIASLYKLIGREDAARQYEKEIR